MDYKIQIDLGGCQIDFENSRVLKFCVYIIFAGLTEAKIVL